MTPEQIKRCAEGAPPPEGMEYSEAITFLAQEVERLRNLELGHQLNAAADKFIKDFTE